MLVNRGLVVVGDAGAVLQCTVYQDIAIYLGQKHRGNPCSDKQ